MKYLSFLFLLFIISCAKEAEIPTYLEVNNIGLKNNLVNKNKSINAADAWIYIDDELTGIHQIPFKIPLITEGTKKLTIKAGVLIYDQQSIREIYPLYTEYDTTITFNKDMSISVSPKVEYVPNTSYLFSKDFENSNNNLKIIRGSKDTTFDYYSSDSKYGDMSGVFNFIKNQDIKVTQSDSIKYNSTDKIYIEIDYKNESTIEFGVDVFTNGKWEESPILLNVPKSNNWNKLYLDPIPYLNSKSNSGYFKFYTKLYYNESGSGKLLLDNMNVIKLVE